jgi:hypothetical protein
MSTEENSIDEGLRSWKMRLWLAISAVVLIYVIGRSVLINLNTQTFYEKEIQGKILSITELGRGNVLIEMARVNIGDTASYDLHLSRFLEYNQIKAGDSLSKLTDTDLVWFYKMRNGEYSEPIQGRYDQ